VNDFAFPGAVRPDSGLRDLVGIAGVGTTDFPTDYRETIRGVGGEAAVLSMMEAAFHRALGDAGIDQNAIDGLAVCGIEERTPSSLRRVADELGVRPAYAVHDSGVMAGVIPRAAEALVAGKCRTMALAYAGTRRRKGTPFGGAKSRSGPVSYFYYHPWGWSSQAAHWAMAFQHYMALYGVTDSDLGRVAVTLRRNAMRNENAIMRDPLNLDGYLSSRFIVRPLRVLDLCLVSDGAVCLILSLANGFDSFARPPVLVSGWADAAVKEAKLDCLVRQSLRPVFESSAQDALSMAGIAETDIDLFEGYDSSSVHLINQLEGYGFCSAGTALSCWASGEMELEGKLPVNTNGGMLSEAFMHGWTQVVELVRQLRHEAGDRQVKGARRGMSSLATTESAHPLILTRGA
jgi:acetyl-CoA acetyltransferase